MVEVELVVEALHPPPSIIMCASCAVCLVPVFYPLFMHSSYTELV
jgi:hypothetical protein